MSRAEPSPTSQPVAVKKSVNKRAAKKTIKVVILTIFLIYIDYNGVFFVSKFIYEKRENNHFYHRKKRNLFLVSPCFAKNAKTRNSYLVNLRYIVL